MAKSLLPIKVIAADICEELGDNTGKHEFRIMKYLAAGYKKMNLFLTQNTEIQTIKLDCSQHVHELPKCFVYETKVGVMQEGTGRIANLWINNKMPAHNFSDTDIENDVNSIWTGEQTTATSYYYNNGIAGEILHGYGTGYRLHGKYNIDREKGLLYTSTSLSGILVVEFKSDGISEGLKLVPSEMQPALRYFAKSMFYEDSNPNMSAVNGDKWEREYNLLKRLYNHKPINMLAQIFQHSF